MQYKSEEELVIVKGLHMIGQYHLLYIMLGPFVPHNSYESGFTLARIDAPIRFQVPVYEIKVKTDV